MMLKLEYDDGHAEKDVAGTNAAGCADTVGDDKIVEI